MKTCLNCNTEYNRRVSPSGRLESLSEYSARKYCSLDCYHEYNVGDRHANYKNGTKIRPDGYIRDSQTDQYIHRIVMEQHIGRELQTREVVHHKDGNPSNNDLSNLELLTNSSHRKIEVLNQRRGVHGKFL